MKIKFRLPESFELLFIRKRLAFFLFVLFPGTPLFSQLPPATEIAGKMTIGWNIGNSLEVPSGETGWGNPKVTQALVNAVSDAGFNTVRIPCAWDSHANQNTLKIDADWLARVGEVVDYCRANDMVVIINCHWDGGWLENHVTEAAQASVNAKQKAYWTQIAEYFKNYDGHLLFAGANEPNVDDAAQMAVLSSYNQTFVDAVRATGGNNGSRALIIQGPSTDIDKTNRLMSSLPADPTDDRLMVEIHYYTPWNFCGMTEDASWGKMFFFWGKNNHSTNSPDRNSTWGEESAVGSNFQSMKTRFVDRGIPVIMGEYGAVKRTSLAGTDLALHIASREYYFEYVTRLAVRHGLIPIYWDNGHDGNNGMALFNRNNGAVVDPGALDALIRDAAAGSSVQERQEPEKESIVEFITALPNPVFDSTRIQVFLEKSARVNISVFNVLGREVASFNDLDFSRGLNGVTWNTGHLSTGIYFIRVNTGEHMLTSKVSVIY